MGLLQAVSVVCTLTLCGLISGAQALQQDAQEKLIPDHLYSYNYEHSTMQELVVRTGYPLEEHFVTTADGYVLGVYRIPSSRGATSKSDAGPPRPPILLQHGLLDSSATWVLNEPSQSLGFILADNGWDVWLGNSRGNAFSRNHTGFDPGAALFWDFTWDDMAAYDLPAVVSHVLRTTGYRQLAYVGHSQGTTQMFAALSTNPALGRQLSVAAMLAPAVYMRYLSSIPMLTLAGMQMDKLFSLVGSLEFLPSRKLTSQLFGDLCTASPLLCASLLTAISGFNPDNTNITRMPQYVQYAPSGTSVKNMAHWAQSIREARVRGEWVFRQYDYGGECFSHRGLPQTCNQRVYGSQQPPSYDLSLVATPFAVFYGGRDKLAAPLDVEQLLEVLPAAALNHTQLLPSYEHLDFTWGQDAQALLYPSLLSVLRRFPPQRAG